MMNLFRKANGKLDRQYLRVCAVSKLLRQGHITFDRAVELLSERMKEADAKQLVSLWRRAAS